MDFEEMKVIWDSQNERPLYAFDEAGLHASVQRKIRAFDRRVFLRDVRDIGIGSITGIGLLWFGWIAAFGSSEALRRLLGEKAQVSRGDSLALLVSSALWLFCAGYQFLERRRLNQQNRGFDPSLRGDLERTLAQTEQQICMAKNAIWWTIMPGWAATVLFLYVLFTMLPTPPVVLILGSIVLPLGFAIDLRCKRRLLRNELLPLKREFEALRHKLTTVEREV